MLLATAIALAWAPPLQAAGPTVVSHADAYVSHADGTETWSIGSANLELAIGFDTSKKLILQKLSNPATARVWNIDTAADATVTLNGELVSLADGTVSSFLGAQAVETSAGVRLTFTFEHRSDHIRFTRSYACYPGSPTIETWTEIDASVATTAVQASDLVGWEIALPNGTVHWTSGLKGDASDSEQDSAFVLTNRDVAPGERVEIGSAGRSSEQYVPFAVVNGDGDQFYGGVMWSGTWRMAFERVGDRLNVSTYFPGVERTVSAAQPLAMPHTFFGIAPAGSPPAAVLNGFVLGIRNGRTFPSLVTYNTWFAYGTSIDEGSMLEEIALASQLGVELVVVDAGWWLGAGTDGTFDFTTGLGNWTVDKGRFPSGLSRLTDAAHARGVKFGIWIEPERVALGTVNKAGLADESWLAMNNGKYGPDTSALICLSQPAARQWVRDRVVALIDAVHPDYIKWDNNVWTNCNRSGHGHGTTDGNFAHVQAFYGILAELRQRYPSLLIENVASGGNRLDFGMLPFTDAAWMSDRSWPSDHVRHNLDGLSAMFPPGYLLSFAIDTKDEPLGSSTTLPLVMRSRMPGLLGITYKKSQVSDGLAGDLRSQISVYRRYRDTIASGHALLLTGQAPVNGWDVIEDLTEDGGRAILFGVKSDDRSGRFTVKPQGLRAGTTYHAVSEDTGDIGDATGDSLMRDGIEFVQSGGSRAHVITITAK